MADEAVTEKIMRDRLLRIFSPYKDLVTFNLCGFGGYAHEIDFLRVLRSGWAYEFEIKVTASDIRAEAAKKKGKHAELESGIRRHLGSVWDGDVEAELAKHSAMLSDQVCAPFVIQGRHTSQICARFAHPIKEFWVVVPRSDLGKLAAELLPQWMGIAVIDKPNPNYWNDRFAVRKAARLPCARKVTDAERMHILQRTASRYWTVYFGRGGFGRGTSTMPKGGAI